MSHVDTPKEAIMSYSDEEVEQGHYRGFDEEKEEMTGPKKTALQVVIWGIILCSLALMALPIVVISSKRSPPSQVPGQTDTLKAIKLEKDNSITFKDVYGCDEAKRQLQTVVEFLKHPEKFEGYKAKMPRGYLLAGPPGVGKTLLAKAVAGESGVDFIPASGASFDEMFVGVGASRVRALFEQARRAVGGKAVIFIDEIDAVAGKRSSFSNDSSRQTLNQLLIEMDGFQGSKSHVIVLAATNTPESLDSAIMRPGRFDKIFMLTPPDKTGRANHLVSLVDGVPLENIDKDLLTVDEESGAKKMDFEWLAELTAGYTGAELANLVNQAKIMAAEENLAALSTTPGVETNAILVKLSKKHFEDAKDSLDKSQKTSSSISQLRKSYRAAGKLIIEKYCAKEYSAFGGDLFGDVPEMPTLGQIKNQLLSNLAGVAAEQVLVQSKLADRNTNPKELNDLVSATISEDLQTANDLARRLVLSGLGKMTSYLNPSALNSEASKLLFDEDVKKIVTESILAAFNILNGKKEGLKAVADAISARKSKDEINAVVTEILSADDPV